ncbi:MAG: oligosaccharide flippase family protein [candidate division WWE3 bacterium]|nr:oligosaccharide flippase family protein [candidate division WWE3 bacterium]
MIAKIKSIITGQTARNVYLVTVGNGLTSLLGFVATIIVSRKLGPVNFGLFSLAFGVFMTASKFTDLGLNFALSRYAAQNAVGRWEPYAKYALTLKIIITLVVTVFGIVGSPILAQGVFHNSELTLLFRLSFLALLGIMLLDFYTALSQALGKWLPSIWIQTAASVFKIIGLLALVFLGSTTILSSYAIYLISPLIGAACGALLISRKFLGPVSVDKAHRQKILGFSVWMGVGVLVAAVTSNLDIFIVGNKLPALDVGLYAAASRFSQVATIITASLGTVLSIRAASFTESRHVKPFLKKTLLLGLFIFIGALIVWPLAGPLITLTVGESFVGSVTIFKILLVAVSIGAARSAISANFFSLEKPQYFAFSSIFSAVMLLVVNHYLIPIFGALGAAYTNLINNILLLVFSLVFIKISLAKKSVLL